MGKDYEEFEYNFTFSYDELLNIKTSLGYAKNRIWKEEDEELKEELIVLRNRLQKGMLKIIKDKRKLNNIKPHNCDKEEKSEVRDGY